MSLIEVRNPHSILMTLRKRPTAVEKLVAPFQGGDRGYWKNVIDEARSLRIKVEEAGETPKVAEEPSRGGRPRGKGRAGGARPPRPGMRGARHERRDKREFGGRTSAGMALIRSKEVEEISDWFAAGKPKKSHGLYLVLDQIQDPQNLGSLFRLAGFFGVRGIIFPRDRSATLGSAVYDIASGGVEAVPFAAVTNLKSALEELKKNEVWLLGTSEHASETLYSVKQDRSWAIVLGNEEKGIRRLTEEACDVLVGIPRVGAVDSLNVSTAGAITLGWLSGTRSEAE